jgi:pyruvate/2-oxoglutarate dehydrogenase complex dihydrolipoamide acyltransferase (E2) component
MPQLGSSVEEGTVVEWKRAVGDAIERGETLCEISTDKVESELPAPAAGTLAEILVPVDVTVAVGTLLARIASAPVDSHSASAAIEPRTGAAQPRHRYSPVVELLASDHGVDLSLVAGTGHAGRITKDDVMSFVDHQTRDALAVGSESTSGPGVIERAPLSRTRTAIAEHMTRSLKTSAHCHTWIDVDMSRVEAARKASGATVLPYVALATTSALQAHPALNAWLEDSIRTLHRDVNLGIAVSLGEDGLIVPVIRRAQELSLDEMIIAIRELAARTRNRQLTPDDVAGATFTITNPGRYGVLMSAPIINQPQVAILDLSVVAPNPVVVRDADDRDAIAIRPTTILGLGWDHRALDGALAAEFLATLKDRLERWSGVAGEPS